MTEELTFIPFSTYSHTDKLCQASYLLCIICRIEPGKNQLVSAIGRGDEYCNHEAIKTWLANRLTEMDEEDLFIRQVERLSDKLLDRLREVQNIIY